MKGKAKGIFEATGFARDRQKLSGYFGRHPVIQKELLERLPDRAAFPA